VKNNVIYGNPTLANSNCISLGGIDVTIEGNFCSGSGGSGIVATALASGKNSGIIADNISKNNNQANAGAAGISLYLNTGASALNWIVKNNHLYDDQTTKTQAYGLGIALSGSLTGFTNVTVEGNDLRGNKTGAFLNNATPTTGFHIYSNGGYNPVGSITAPGVPASGTALTNNTGLDVNVYLKAGSTADITAVAINGTTLTGVVITHAVTAPQVVRLPANQSITLTYAAGGTAPSWQWIAE
jgi:hypothetical protein